MRGVHSAGAGAEAGGSRPAAGLLPICYRQPLPQKDEAPDRPENSRKIRGLQKSGRLDLNQRPLAPQGRPSATHVIASGCTARMPLISLGAEIGALRASDASGALSGMAFGAPAGRG